MSENDSVIGRALGCVYVIMIITPIVLFAAGCVTGGEAPAPVVKPMVSLTEEQDRLLQIIEDESNPYNERLLALRALRDQASSACIPRLLNLLPGEWGQLTRANLVILKNLGEPAALPELERMLFSLRSLEKRTGQGFSGRLVSDLLDAIEACQDGEEKRVLSSEPQG